MNEKDKEFARMLDAALRFMLGLPTPGDVMKMEIVHIPTASEPIDGLTNSFEGVRTQCEYAELEARLLKREYCAI